MDTKVDLRLQVVSPISKSLLYISGIRDGSNSVRRSILNFFDPVVPPRPCKHVFAEDVQIPVRHIPNDVHSVGARFFVPIDPPAQDKLRPLIIWSHGGGFAIGSAFSGTTDSTCRNLAKIADVIVLAIDYRLSPEFKHPCQIEDLWGVLLWLQETEHSVVNKVDFGKLIVGGDSAGGNLSTVMCLVANERRYKYKISHQLLVYPWFPRVELTPSQKEHGKNGYMVTNEHDNWFRASYLPSIDLLSSYLVNPLLAPKHRLSHLPPAHIITAGYDPIQDDGVAYGDLLRSVGVKVTHTHVEYTAHGFFTLMFLPEAKETHVRVAEVLRHQFWNV